jgi:Flp pilus assembly protein TadB
MTTEHSENSQVPPAGEEIHLPGPSLQPILLAVGITVALVGVTTSIILVIAGGILTLAVLIRWIRDARREYNELPLEHHH